MVGRCANRQCHRFYWRYRGDYPPPRYCSVWCHETRVRRAGHAGEALNVVAAAIRRHRAEVHRTDELSEWFDCAECARLEERQAQAAGGAVWN